MTELPTDGQLRGPSFLRLMGIKLPTDDVRIESGPHLRSTDASKGDGPQVSVPTITIGERSLLPAAKIYTLRSVPTSARYRLSINAEECVAEHEARLAESRNGSKTSLICHQVPVKALKSPAPSPEANVHHATRAFVSEAREVAPSQAADHAPWQDSKDEDVLWPNKEASETVASRSPSDSKQPATDTARILGFAAPTRIKPVRRTSRKAIPVIDDEANHPSPHHCQDDDLNGTGLNLKAPVSNAFSPAAVIVPRSSTRTARPKSIIEVAPKVSHEPLPARPADIAEGVQQSSDVPSSHIQERTGTDTTASTASATGPDHTGKRAATRDCLFYVYRWELTPRLQKAYDKRYQGDIPKRIAAEDLLEQIALDLFRESMWQAQAPPSSSDSPTLGELEDWFKFLMTVNRFEEAHMVMEMTERMLRHCREILAVESVDNGRQLLASIRSGKEPLGDQVMRIVEAHLEHPRLSASSGVSTRSDPSADHGQDNSNDGDPHSSTGIASIAAPFAPSKVQTSKISRVQLLSTPFVQISAENRQELGRLQTTASLFAMQFTKDEAAFISQHAARVLRAYVPCYTGRDLVLAGPGNIDPLPRKRLNSDASGLSAADKERLLSPQYFSTLIEQQRDAKEHLHQSRHAHLEMASPRVRNGELGRHINGTWYPEEDISDAYRLAYGRRREANLRAVIDYVITHRKLETYKVSRDILLSEMDYDSARQRRHEEEASEDSGFEEDLLTPDAIQRALHLQQQHSYNVAQAEETDTLEPLSAIRSQAVSLEKAKLARPVSVISDALGITQRLPVGDQSEERLVEKVPTAEEEGLPAKRPSKPTMIRMETDFATSHETLARYHTWLTDLPPRPPNEVTENKGHLRRRSIEVAKDLAPNLATKVSHAFSRSMDNLLMSFTPKPDDNGNAKSPTFKEAIPMVRRRSIMKVFHSRKTSYAYKEDFAPVENIAPTTPSVKITSPSPPVPKPSRSRGMSDTEYTVMQIEGVSRPQTAQERNIQLRMDFEAAERRMYDLLPRGEKFKIKMKKAGKKMVHKIQDAADLAIGRR